MVTKVITTGLPELQRSPLHALFRQLLSFPVVVACALATMVFFLLPKSVADPDIWWHLRNVQSELALHGMVWRDAYSYTVHGALWVNPEWLAEWPYYLAWHALGLRGLFLVYAAAIEIILLGVFFLAWSRTRNPIAALLASFIALMFATVSFGPRTLLFGWICLVAELILLDRVRERPRLAWLLPPLFVFWINAHGSWLIGLVLLGIFCACNALNGTWGDIHATRLAPQARRHLFCAAVASLLCLFANPYGWRLVLYPFNFAWKQRLNVASIQEWQSLDFHSARGKIMIATLALLIVFALVRRRSRALHEIAFLLIAIYSALTYSRFLFLAGILIAPMLAQEICGFFTNKKHEPRPWLHLACIAVMATLAVVFFPSTERLKRDLPATYPQQALPQLAALHGNLFNDFLWGGYLELNAPAVPVFIDSRVDIFEYAGILKDYLNVIHLHDSLAILDKYRIRYVLFERDAPLVYLLEHTPSWKVKYQDKTAVLLERISK